ncbi:YopT-type cysteine protease domain-containing protein [Massilia sp. W12]|uniref:YopT-type cysteine protease domain-containing protein n=1 Tax=Massilia sp. W12 TaxID=3126507 RepID=UPI0030D39CBF
MFYMQQSNQYTLNYSFCQTDTTSVKGVNDGFDDAVRAEHGICCVLGLDWLEAKLRNQAFVVTWQSIYANARMFNTLEAAYDKVYANYCPNLRRGNIYSYDITSANCLSAVNQIQNPGGIAIHLGVSLDRNDASGHMVCIVRNGRQYKMFDSNFGEYTASSARACAHWLHTLCNTNRPERGRYLDWTQKLHAIQFSV